MLPCGKHTSLIRSEGAPLQAKAVAIDFSVSGISRDNNKEYGDSLQVNSTKIEFSSEVILGY